MTIHTMRSRTATYMFLAGTLIATEANAAWILQPSAQIEASSYDNVRLSEIEQEGYSSTLSAQARVGYRTELTTLSVTGNLLHRGYSGVDDVPGLEDPDDRSEHALTLFAQTRMERIILGMSGVTRRDVLLRRSEFIAEDADELGEEAPPEAEELEELTEDAGVVDTNVIQEQVRRTFYQANPFLAYQFSERTTVRLGYQYLAQKFGSDGANLGLQDSESNGVTFAVQSRLDERNNLNFNLRTTNFEPDIGLESDTYEATVGLTRRFTERLRLGLQLGSRRVESDVAENDGFVFRATARWRTERGSLSASVGRTVTATAFGDIAERDRIRVTYRQKLNDRFDFSLRASAFKTDRDNGDSQRNRESVTVEPRLGIRLSESFSTDISYRYRFIERGSDIGSVEGNTISVALVYRPPRQL